MMEGLQKGAAIYFKKKKKSTQATTNFFLGVITSEK